MTNGRSRCAGRQSPVFIRPRGEDKNMVTPCFPVPTDLVMPLSLTVFDFFLLGIATVFVALRQWSRRAPLPLPPGPKGWPLIGNMLNMPNENFAQTYMEWGRKYGAQTRPLPYHHDLMQTDIARLRQYCLHQCRRPATRHPW